MQKRQPNTKSIQELETAMSDIQVVEGGEKEEKTPFVSTPVLSPLPTGWLTWPLERQSRELVPWLDPSHYLFIWIPLSFEKHGSPFTTLAAVPKDPSQPLSNQNFMLTTEFLKRHEVKYGRMEVYQWLYYYSFHGDRGANFHSFLPHHFRIPLEIEADLTQSWSQKRAVLQEYATELKNNKRLKQERMDIKRQVQLDVPKSKDSTQATSNTDIRTLLTVLNTSAMGHMMTEVLGIQSEYVYCHDPPPTFDKLSTSDTAYAIKHALSTQHSIPIPQTAKEREAFNQAAIRASNSFFDPDLLKQYLPVATPCLKHVEPKHYK
jgi:hypothetical protein